VAAEDTVAGEAPTGVSGDAADTPAEVIDK
jgi:hypothetical protein